MNDTLFIPGFIAGAVATCIFFVVLILLFSNKNGSKTNGHG